jgi:phosphoglycerate dehydrogenase-like enzyme
MLALLKRLNHWDREMKAGNWTSRFESHPRDLAGATVGIVGLGAIGGELAKLLRGFDAHVIAYDPLQSEERTRALGVTLVGFDALIESSDVVALHAPLMPETRGMINRDVVGRLKPGAILINLARGGLIESLDVLCEGLDSGQLGGVGLDVFDPEPPDHTHAIFSRPDVITTPHALGTTRGSMAQIFESMATDMAAVLSGGRPRHVANPEALNESIR